MMNVSLAAYLLACRIGTLITTYGCESSGTDAIIVRPRRVKVKTEDVAVGNLQSRELFLEIFQTVLGARVIVASSPAVAVKPHTWRVHTAVKHDMVTISVNKPLAFNMERGQRLGNGRPCTHCQASSEKDR